MLYVKYKLVSGFLFDFSMEFSSDVSYTVNDAVRYKDLLDDPYADMSNLLKSCGNVCSIIYCLERSTCDDLNRHLDKQGIPSAGM